MASKRMRVSPRLRSSFIENARLCIKNLESFKSKIEKMSQSPSDNRVRTEMQNAKNSVMAYGYIVESMAKVYGDDIYVEPGKRKKQITREEVLLAIGARKEVRDKLAERASAAREAIASRYKRRKPGSKRTSNEVSSRQPDGRTKAGSTSRRIY